MLPMIERSSKAPSPLKILPPLVQRRPPTKNLTPNRIPRHRIQADQHNQPTDPTGRGEKQLLNQNLKEQIKRARNVAYLTLDTKMGKVKVIGGGLAGSEAAWQLARAGIAVDLHEMRPALMTRAHKTGELAELVCSNSFRGASLTNAVGLLKEELRQMGSLIMAVAEKTKVPAGGALAVDRVAFSNEITRRISNEPLITVHAGEIVTIPTASRNAPAVVATGPLTSERLAEELKKITGSEHLSFYDAISPIITAESLDHNQLFRQSRYNKGAATGTGAGDDYLNIPLTREQYLAFIEAVANGEKFSSHDPGELENLRPFEGCMPIEDMIERGPDTLRHGPLKPMGLVDPRTGEKPYAVIQLRQDDAAGTLWSMVGMQTRLKHGEQLRIFRSLPGLAEAEFVRLGTVHRNTFVNSPRCLSASLEFRSYPGLFLAGQVTGVEGYVESTAAGLVAGINAGRLVTGCEPVVFPIETAIGALLAYVSDPERKEFQPMNISFGLMPSYFAETKAARRENKEEKRLRVSTQALASLKSFAAEKLHA